MEIEQIGGLLFFVGLILALSYSWVLLTKGKQNKENRFVSTFLVFLYCTSWLVFVLNLLSSSFQYDVPIDPVDNGYTPLSKNHGLTFFVFFFLSLMSIQKIWKYGKKQPPLLVVLFMSFLVIGIVLNTVLALQLSFRNDGVYYISNSNGLLMLVAPVSHIVVSVILLVKIIREEAIVSSNRSFKNKLLNYLNDKIRSTGIIPLWGLMALVPVYLIITAVLILFGQEFDSLAKVFTETTTWHFSQKTHPPYLDHRGHYLCTVAACGDPKIVRPLRLGNRNGQEIIVNRQLLIANAFEHIIQTNYPRIHRFIRRNYDKYGYPLSKDINTRFKSSVTYVLMKPVEWIFLIVIYSASKNPEKLINGQYK